MRLIFRIVGLSWGISLSQLTPKLNVIFQNVESHSEILSQQVGRPGSPIAIVNETGKIGIVADNILNKGTFNHQSCSEQNKRYK